jgi:hypothetical protein
MTGYCMACIAIFGSITVGHDELSRKINKDKNEKNLV